MKEVNPTVDTTKFVNIHNKSHDIYIDGKLARHLDPGEEDVMPVFVARIGAKHLADKVMFAKGIRDVNRPSPVRDQILAKILPELQEEVKVKPLTPEEFQAQIKEELKTQGELLATLQGEGTSKELAKVKKELDALKKKVAKKQ